MVPGDVVLVEALGQGWISRSIVLGARLRQGWGSPHARYSHCAVVYDAPTDDPDAVRIVEATASSGVHRTFLSKYAGRGKVLHLHVGEEDWKEMKAFLDDVLAARPGYGFVTYAGLTLYALTGTKLCLQEAGTATCAGLVCDALTRAGLIWRRPPYACTPADIDAQLAADFAASPIDSSAALHAAGAPA
jgi:hypothetical protein